MYQERITVYWTGSVCKHLACLIIFACLVFGQAPTPAQVLAQSSPDAAPPTLPTPAEPGADPGPLKFEHLSLQEGLSQSSVYAIAQDSQGFLWFGTQDGLNKYDGYDWTVYRHASDDPDTLSHSVISTLYQDQEGTLWIGTDGGGLNRFDPDTGQFVHYRAQPDGSGLSGDYIRAILQDREGTLWVGTCGSGLNRFDRTKGRFKHYHHKPGDSRTLSSETLSVLYEDRAGTLWVGTSDGGLNRFDRDTGQFIRYQHDPDDPHSLSSNDIAAIYEDREGRFWVGTDDGGLNRLDRTTGQAIHYRHDPDDPYSLSDDAVSAIHQDREGTLWIGTFGGGLNVLDPGSESQTGRARFFHYQNDLDDERSLSSDFILSIWEDQMGVLWIGTHGGGINKLNLLAKPFVHYQARPQDDGGLSNNVVWAIYEDQAGILWVGSNGGGLDRFDRSSGQVTHYRHAPNEPHSLGNNVVRAIYEEPDGTFWLGLDDGKVDRFDRSSGRFVHYQLDTSASVPTIHRDAKGQLWVGSFGGGLYWFDASADRFVHYKQALHLSHCLSSEYVHDIYEDPDGVLWLATIGGGLNKFEPGQKRLTHYMRDDAHPDSLSNNNLLSIHQGQAGTLWIGTQGGGLNQFDPGTETFTHYREQDGLANDVVYGILEDAQGYLWLSTNRGLSRFDPQRETFRNYDVSDGLQSNEFNGGAYFQSQSGEMFFGGINGFNTFFPEALEDNRQAPPVVITAFKKFNQTVRSDLANGEQIELSYQDNFVSFEFAALDYAAPEQNQYAYMMEGLDPDWVEAGTRRHVDYPDLKPGHYTFHVKGSNSDGVWNESGTSIHITITPPFWATWWFRGGMLLLLVAGVWVAHRLRVASIETRSRELAVLVQQRTAELQREIDQRADAEEALRQSEMEKAVAAERSRLARNLHDAISQTLFSASLIAEALPKSWERDKKEGQQLLNELRLLTQGALAEMRTLLLELRPEALVEANLGDLMRQLAEAAAVREGLPVTVDVDGGGTVPHDVHVALYRIAQEALNNVIKQARVRQVTIDLNFVPLTTAAEPAARPHPLNLNDGWRVELGIREEGRGFDLDALPPERLGLDLIRERAESVGARLTVESEVGRGTCIMVVWENGQGGKAQ